MTLLKHILLVLALASIMLTCSCFADKGVIPFGPYSIEETGQVAIVAWNGGVEVLILSNDLHVSGEGNGSVSALEILPLPSMPEVEKGDWRSFSRLASYVLSKSTYKEYAAVANIVLHKRIGPHDVYVLKVDNASSFIKWLNQYAAKNNFALSLDLSDLEYIVQEYVDKGYNFFVVDRVEVPFYEVRTVSPLVYVFNSSLIYYPMKISSIGYSGWMSVNLFVVTKSRIELSEVKGFKVYQQVKLSHEQLKAVDHRIADLIGGDGWVTLLKFSGSIAYADDLEVQPKAVSEALKFTYLALPLFAGLVISTYLSVKDVKLGRFRGTRDRKVFVATLLLILIGAATALATLQAIKLILEGVLPMSLEMLLSLLTGVDLCVAVLALFSAALLLIYNSKKGGILGVASCLIGLLSFLSLAIYAFTPYKLLPIESLLSATWSLALIGLMMFIPEIVCLILLGLGWDSLR